jgi:hypothetical protein
MAKGIIKGAGKLLGIGKKKAAPAAVAPAEEKGPIIKQLGAATPAPRRKTLRPAYEPTILSDKLGA